MASCIRCGRDTATGGLCPEHAEALATCAEITAEQLRFAPADPPAAYLVDLLTGNTSGITASDSAWRQGFGRLSGAPDAGDRFGSAIAG